MSRGSAQSTVQRVRGQICRVQLARREPAELRHDRVGPHPRGIQQQLALDERRDRRAGGRQRAAAFGFEPGLDDAIAIDAHRDADQITAERTAGVAVMPAGTQSAAPVGRGEVLCKALHSA